jgi:hypothetical protein
MIKVLLLSWLITRFKPLTNFIQRIPLTKSNLLNLIVLFVKYITICMMCAGLWIGLIMTGDIYISIGCAFIGFWYDNLLTKYEQPRL